MPSAGDDAMRPMFLIVALFLSITANLVQADMAGEVTHLSGTLSVVRSDGISKLLSVKSQISEGDTLATEEGTYARIRFIDGAEVVLRPSTRFKVNQYRYENAKPENDGILTSLLKGGLRSVTGMVAKRNKDKVSYQTPTATIGIRGTHFGALFCKGDCQDLLTPAGRTPRDGLHVDVAAGRVAVTNKAGTLEVGSGEFAYVQDENTLPRLVPEEDSFRVTMPSALAVNRGVGDGIGSICAGDCIIE